MDINELSEKINRIKSAINDAFNELHLVGEEIPETISGDDRSVLVDYITRTAFSFEKAVDDLERLRNFTEQYSVFDRESHTPVEETSDEDDDFPRLDEGFNGDWAILPCTMDLYGKRKVDIIEAASTWPKCSVFICQKPGEKRFLFVVGFGDYRGYDIELGRSYSAYHDQTGASKGMYTVVNMVRIVNGEIVEKENDIGINEKASVSVFK